MIIIEFTSLNWTLSIFTFPTCVRKTAQDMNPMCLGHFTSKL